MMHHACFTCLLTLVATLLFHPAKAQQPEENAAQPEIRAAGVKILVEDVDAALAFYRDLLGFAVQANDAAAGLVQLGGADGLLVLARAHRAHPVDGKHARAELVLQVHDVRTTAARLRQGGAPVLEDEPNENGVGIDMTVVDPFGTQVALMEQQIEEPPPFEEPKIYNYGLSVPDMAAARAFYVDALGFVVRSEKYYPPAIPLGHADGSFGFMLHENKDLAPADAAYPTDTGTVILFETDDLDAAMAALRAKGATLVHDTPQPSPLGRYVAFRGPAGIVSELYQRR